MMPQIPVLVYHKVDFRFEYSISRISPHRFTSHLNWLQTHKYNTVTISRAVELIQNGDKIPSRTVAIVFDDGFENVYTHAFPLLRARDMTATVYMVAGYAGKEDAWDVKIGWKRFRHLSWDQISELVDYGFEIGSHSVNHPDLTHINDDQLRYELSESRRTLQRETGTPVNSFSYPFGSYSDQINTRIVEAGYNSAVLVRNNNYSEHNTFLVTLQGACVYSTTRLRRLDDILQCRSPSPLYNIIERGIGWCAGRTPIVKGPPVYPENV